jgi:hypothetical protein
MARIVQPEKHKGSQRWLQEIVSSKPDLLNSSLTPRLGSGHDVDITWLSPLTTDEFAEYRDQAFLDRLGIRLEHRALASFWPSNGPQWDALGKTNRGDFLLVEAKAHIGELNSDCGAGPESLQTIRQSLDEAGRFFGASSTCKWTGSYYQYANRLAHLYLLRQLNHVPAWLVFLYFVNAGDVGGPKSAEEWRPAIERMHAHLGIAAGRLHPHVIEAFVDVVVPAAGGKKHAIHS